MTARIVPGATGLPEEVDVLVVGLGVTGAGVALDAVSRGLSVAAVEAQDVAWGTSRFSSKLVHGGLRYLAKLQLGVAHESAVERGILMEHTAPHLTHALPFVLPLTPAVTRAQEHLAVAGLRGGDLLRLGARTSRETLPRPRRIGVTETLALAPAVRQEGLRGGLLSWDGQLEDDARLVVAIARTAASLGAHVHTRVRVLSATGNAATLRDELTGETRPIRARAVVNATGVWADRLDPALRLRPSRGSHLVVRRASLPHVRCGLMVPVPGHGNRFVFTLPQPDETCYIGLTDEPVDGVADVPVVPEADVDFLLSVVNEALEVRLGPDAVVGAYAGLRPLLAAAGATADLSRRHAVLVSDTGVVTVVGGKLTTYRRMAQDAVDRAVTASGLPAGPCRTRVLPLLGAAPRAELRTVDAPLRLVRRFGTEAPAVLAAARAASGLPDDVLLAPASATVPVTLAELVFGVTHEGATTVDDLLDRRTRVGLVEEDRDVAVPHAERALALSAAR
ncbi:MAG TPA: glycerol-3-phosphate dehydrogenase/oxidase [Marmoricola sp.]|nr:glycerol-3-phosphate dehydrogenase/oxidase [Marmoricola sp.]